MPMSPEVGISAIYTRTIVIRVKPAEREVVLCIKIWCSGDGEKTGDGIKARSAARGFVLTQVSHFSLFTSAKVPNRVIIIIGGTRVSYHLIVSSASSQYTELRAHPRLSSANLPRRVWWNSSISLTSAVLEQ